MIANQSELFDEEKIFHGANAVKLPYWKGMGSSFVLRCPIN